MAYSAANNFMKALVRQRRQRGLAGSTMDLSHLLGAGYIERELKSMPTQQARDHAVRLMKNSGTLVMSESDLHQLFAEAIVAGRPGSGADPELVTGVKTVRPGELPEVIWRNQVRLGHFIQHVGASALPVADDGRNAAAASVKTQLKSAADENELRTILRGEWRLSFLVHHGGSDAMLTPQQAA